jgi:hypothetical protein
MAVSFSLTFTTKPRLLAGIRTLSLIVTVTGGFPIKHCNLNTHWHWHRDGTVELGSVTLKRIGFLSN